jgi:hypothetical protein
MSDFDTEIAEARRQAAALEPHGSCATDEELGRRAERWVCHRIAAGSPIEAGHAAFEVQRAIDLLHSRVIGECAGCAKTGDNQWAHRLNCATVYAPGHGGWSIALDHAGSEVIVLD